MYRKKILFISNTRADYGKIKSVILGCEKKFKTYIFVTGMHLLKEYGSTYIQLLKDCKKTEIYRYKNQTKNLTQDIILANTIYGFNKYLKKIKPDLIITHGDRIETLAAAISGSVNNFLVTHIEGGELSGTIDEHLRHSISKLSHLHFVSNQSAKKRLSQMGEKKNSIFETGSPDLDIMKDRNLPSISDVKKRYKINFKDYIISIFHPVTTELSQLSSQTNIYFNALRNSDKKIILIYPNNDPGSKIILNQILKFKKNKNIKIIKSMRFEYFLRLLKECKLIIGNSSSAIREAPFYGVPTINVGSRQNQRALNIKSIFNVNFDTFKILKKINYLYGQKFKKNYSFGRGNSTQKILKILNSKSFWKTSLQKKFVSLNQ